MNNLLQRPCTPKGNNVYEWGDWDDNILLDSLDVKHLQEVHYPYEYKHERATTVKKSMKKGTPILQLATQMKGLRGYSLRSLQKDALALSRAQAEREQTELRNY